VCGLAHGQALIPIKPLRLIVSYSIPLL